MQAPLAPIENQSSAPLAHEDEAFLQLLRQKGTHLPSEEAEAMERSLAHPEQRRFLAFIRRHSPYLARLLELHPVVWVDFCRHAMDHTIDHIYRRYLDEPVQRRLRLQKQQLALAVAMADLQGFWDWERVTATLSDFAGYSVEAALGSLLEKAIAQQTLSPQAEHGIFVLGMGKLGGGELNYSSDIDLIILYDPDKLPYTGRQSPQHFMTRLAQELTALLQDRTGDGYVFRTDLRLRPDPASTPLAVSTAAALRYYESVGQNWERAAMIKARVIAGDKEAGNLFLKELQPFLWRTHLDFASVADILSIKRQMQNKYDEAIDPYSHNIKTGRGGIREIEFLAQIFQLIWGGRIPELRRRKTVEVLELLVQRQLLNGRIASRLIRSYAFFRTVEHRLQMQNDQQTHTLPGDEPGMAQLAEFLGYPTTSKLVTTLSRHLRRVHHHFSRAFEDTAAPLSGEGKLVFTGVDPDPETLKELRRMGFAEPDVISAAIQDWHKGNRRCTRTKRSRQLLTEMVPEILRALAATTKPDEAFRFFDSFITHLPSGVQLFSLYASNRSLLQLTADILGSAPSLGSTLSQNPGLFDAVLSGGFFDPLLSKQALRQERAQWLRLGRNEEEKLNRLTTFQKEKLFQAGVHLLKYLASPAQIGHFLSDLADSCLEWVVQSTQEEFSERYGRIPDGELIVLGLGKLGSRELTFGSDLDLIFLYDASDDVLSDGERPLNASAYFNRLAQRVVGRLTALTRQGHLYDVDTRLRPFGKDGPMAVSLAAFARYYSEAAWLFERLALTRARPVVGSEAGEKKAQALLASQLGRTIPPEEIAAAIRDMRRRIDESFPTQNPWDVKHIPGGLMDVDFLLQYLTLRHYKELPPQTAHEIGKAASRLAVPAGWPPETVRQLEDARALQTDLLFYLRLCSNGQLDETQAPDTLKRLLAQACQAEDFGHLKARLMEHQARIRSMLDQL